MDGRPQIHPTAVVDDGAEIGSGTCVWHFTHVCAGARIGRDCVLGQNVYVAAGARIGERVHIQNNVSIYDGVTLEDEVFCGPSVVFTNVINPRSAISRKDEYRPTLVRRGVTLGANSTIICGVTLGPYAFVGAGSVVTRDVGEHALMVGTPARQLGWMSEAGERLYLPLRGEGEALCPASGARYRLGDGRVWRVRS